MLSITPPENDCSTGSFRPLVTAFLVSNALATLELVNFEILKIDEGTNYGKQFLLTRFILWVNGYAYKVLCVYSFYVLWNTPEMCRFYSTKVTLTYREGN